SHVLHGPIRLHRRAFQSRHRSAKEVVARRSRDTPNASVLSATQKPRAPTSIVAYPASHRASRIVEGGLELCLTRGEGEPRRRPLPPSPETRSTADWSGGRWVGWPRLKGICRPCPRTRSY